MSIRIAPALPDLEDAVARDPFNHTFRGALIERLDRGRQVEAAAHQRAFLAYLMAGGRPAVCDLAEALVDALGDRRIGCTLDFAAGPPPAIRLAPECWPVADLATEGAELVVKSGGWEHRAAVADVGYVARLVVPFDAIGQERLGRPELQRAVAGDLALLAEVEGMARKAFPRDPEAVEVAHLAVARAALLFDGWGHWERLAKVFVRRALQTHARSKARAAARGQTGLGETDPAAPVDGPQEQARADVLDLLAQLAPSDQDLVRRRLAGESTEDIALALGLHVRGVERRLQRLRRDVGGGKKTS